MTTSIPAKLASLYLKLIGRHPLVILALFLVLLLVAVWYARYFELDASADSLILENDTSLNYYREISQKYASDDFVVITYKPDSPLFSRRSLDTIRALRDNLLKLNSIASVVSILDVPIIYQSGLKLSALSDKLQSIDSGFRNYQLAEKEFKTNPLYRNLLVNKDATITALQAVFKRDRVYEHLQTRRTELQSLGAQRSPAEERELAQVRQAIRIKNREYARHRNQDIYRIRQIINAQRDTGKLYLGGVPMITVDMIQYIRHDLVVFGAGVFVFLVLILWVFFHDPYWVVIPLAICSVTGLLAVGVLGYADWAVTVISSNFLSILLIITLSLTIHLIVRYRDLQQELPEATHRDLVRSTISSMVVPCLYTVLTTVVAFASLVVCNIRPVINFGWIMVIGLGIAFIVSFSLMPAMLYLKKTMAAPRGKNITRAITLGIARLVQYMPRSIVIIAILLIGFSIIGISRLKVENRFINNFKSDTEIYQGMKLIDRELGGTMPLDIILDPDRGYLESRKKSADETDNLLFSGTEAAPVPGYWLNSTMIHKAEQIQKHLDSYPVIGKVRSIVNSLDIFEKLNGGPFDAFELGLLRKRIPKTVADTLFTPYLSKDGNELRYNMRIIESDPKLNRKKLLDSIHRFLIDKMHLQEGQVHLTGMMELYNNMLQSLFRSQILSIGAVSVAIMCMFLILFRNLRLALIAAVPNLFSTVMIMGVMGWAGIPLDMMTITIASITLGISVDNTIHYLHRLQREYPRDRDFRQAVMRCHGGIGKSMYYTSMAIIFGFAILALSNFIPTVYFGLLVGCALFFALVGDLILLPAVVLLVRPRIKQLAASYKGEG